MYSTSMNAMLNQWLDEDTKKRELKQVFENLKSRHVAYSEIINDCKLRIKECLQIIEDAKEHLAITELAIEKAKVEFKNLESKEEKE